MVERDEKTEAPVVIEGRTDDQDRLFKEDLRQTIDMFEKTILEMAEGLDADSKAKILERLKSTRRVIESDGTGIKPALLKQIEEHVDRLKAVAEIGYENRRSRN